jgi:hypothetical protein
MANTSFVEHVSLRAAWHDHGWNGTVCQDPTGNASCILLKNIGPNRDDSVESTMASRHMAELSGGYVPPCIDERATFMSPKRLGVVRSHPFGGNPALKAIRPTRIPLPAYSAHATPYRWMLRQEVPTALAEREDVFRPVLEEQVDRAMGWRKPGAWVMHGDNQQALFEEFFRTVIPETSLVFFYAKHTPLAEDPQRVLLGAGRVTNIELPGRYDTNGEPAFPAQLWETVVHHSLRPAMTDGILLPYQAILAAADADPSLDLGAYVAHAPADAWGEFSYVTEHVSHDSAIDALLTLERSARAQNVAVGGVPPSALAWIDEQVNRLWQLRGPCPGLGSALTAFGIDRGTLLAHRLARHIPEGGDPWPVVEQAFADPVAFGDDVTRHLTPVQCRKWSRLGDQRKALLRLLSRFAITTEQAQRWYRDPEERNARGLTDEAILANPYLLYEHDRPALDPIAVMTIDRGILPMEPIATDHPLPAPSAMLDNLDPRRVQALVVDVLEEAAEEGHTLLPETDVVGTVRARPLGQSCPLDTDTLEALDLSAAALAHGGAGPLAAAELASGSPALQLQRLAEVGTVIRAGVDRRLRAPRHTGDPDFTTALANELDKMKMPEDAEGQALEERARAEKLAALGELYRSRVSVLVGSAGTGKTTLLRVLCQEPTVAQGGVLLLAPTGKARVQLTTRVRLPGYTIAQFLIPHRYDFSTGRYMVTGDPATRKKTYKTVVIDEASMLTEEQLAATLDALAGVERLILVGDHRQLPPIGAGRPFVDVVQRLAPANAESMFPRVAPGYAELTVQRRQEGTERDDLQLAAWFGGGTLPADADEVWQRLRAGEDRPTLRAVRWQRGGLDDALVQLLSEELRLPREGDLVAAFEQSYGGTVGDDGRVWFNAGRPSTAGRPGTDGAASRSERWQILTPVRARAWGSTELNRGLKRRFRGQALESALKPPWERWFPEPIGPEEIVYGDKVMNVQNTRFSERRVFPVEGALRYVANGEIGVVVGQTKGGPVKWTPNKTEVEFSSQPGYKYTYYDWAEAADLVLELAWAITVHKAQGSEFELVILVLPETARALSRELFYTALTRQRRKVVIFHEGELDALLDATAPGNSETARRLTNLFEAPAPIDIAGERLDERLIHRTSSGVLVRSKNEVIIANLLTELGVDWTYEEPFAGADGRIVRPDFTIRTDTGMTVLWEHLGMLDNLRYRRKWETKLAWYQANGITPMGDAVGPRGVLITTDDREGVNSEEWVKLARSVLLG